MFVDNLFLSSSLYYWSCCPNLETSSQFKNLVTILETFSVIYVHYLNVYFLVLVDLVVVEAELLSFDLGVEGLLFFLLRFDISATSEDIFS